MTVPRRVDGVDISHHQAHDPGFKAARAAGVKWMYHKATEGTSFIDEDYTRRRTLARDARFPFGGYHFALANGSAKAEANHFKSVLGDTDLMPCLDLERTGGRSRKNLTDWVHEFLYTMGEPCVIYTPYALDDYFGSVRWRPRYNSENDPPHLSWDIWQFSNGTDGQPNSVPGFGHVDLNTMRTGFTLNDLLRGSDMEQDDPLKNTPAAAVVLGTDEQTVRQLMSRTGAYARRADLQSAQALAIVEQLALGQGVDIEAIKQAVKDALTELIND